MNFPPRAFDWLAHHLGCDTTQIQVSRLKGGISTSVFRVENGTQRVILRLFDNAPWLAHEPDLPHHERAALEVAHSAGVSAPRFLAVDENGEIFAVPALLMSFCQGEINIVPENLTVYLQEIARVLAQIHDCGAPDLGFGWKSWTPIESIRAPDWTTQPTLWQRAVSRWRSGVPQAPRVLLHRDFHPMNLLWEGEKIAAVVDWPNACLGPAGVDVAHLRVNLALMFGANAAKQFLEFYCQQRPNWKFEAFFELDSIFDWANPTPQFYEPWADFGVPKVSADELGARLEAHLAQILIDRF